MESADPPFVNGLSTVAGDIKLDLSALHKLNQNRLVNHVIYSRQGANKENKTVSMIEQYVR